MNKVKVGFGRIFWPSLIAALIVSILGSLIFILFVAGFIGGLSADEEFLVKENSVLHLKLDGSIRERSSKKFNPTTFSFDSKLGVADIITALELAEKDDDISGVFVEIDGLNCGYSSAREIREAMEHFKESGKFIVSYNSGELITQKEYYLSSAADKVYGFPSSNLELTGLGSELTFFKGTLDKLELDMLVIRGRNNDFKSAVEPYFLEKMSDSSRLQMDLILRSIWTTISDDISATRKLKKGELDKIARDMLVKRSSDAVAYKLMDAVKYRDEVLKEIAEKTGVEEITDINLLSFEKYMRKRVYQEQVLIQNENPNVAVILAEGGISVSGDEMTSSDICHLLREARANKSVKTVVLRINSPGGSALASDEIWREVQLTNKAKKVIVSMGDVAASGGYYIASPASTIFAEPSTITGSIGVFGVIPYTGDLMQNKLGLTFDRVYTHNPAFSTNRRLTDNEVSIIQEEVDAIYDEFLSRVAEGRGMSKDKVDQIARGRVWSGTDAKRIGLVDQIGGLTDAIEYAAKGADIDMDELKVVYYPLKKEDKWAKIMENLDDDDEKSIEQTETKIPEELVKHYMELKKIEQLMGVQMRLPFVFTLQ
ncbi:MAG: signal peptide peptidase SppA [Crocinitomicaceae bacterium]|jgi:protease-4|nr:signal peptide peptidase SppA [Crocinitomicaceae bacterium]